MIFPLTECIRVGHIQIGKLTERRVILLGADARVVINCDVDVMDNEADVM